MEKLDLYIEWKELVKESKEINERKRKVKQKLGNIHEFKNDLYAFRSENHTRANDMIQLYEEGSTLQEIGSIYDISRERVRQIISAVGITGKDGGVSKRKENRRELMVQLVNEGKTVEDIAQELQLSRVYVRLLAAEYGLSIKTSNRKRFGDAQKKVKSLHDEGYNQLEIAEKLGVSQNYASNTLLEVYGIRKRNKFTINEIAEMQRSGLSIKEIAERTGTTQSNIYQRLQRYKQRK